MDNSADFGNAIAVMSCSDTEHEEIILKILGVEELPKHDQVQPDLNSYPWHIETKYYSADANFIAFKSQDLSYDGGLEALVIHFDNNKLSSFEEVHQWMSYMSKFEPDVRLLACDNCSDGLDKAVTREKILDWCLKHQFELVELYPTEESDEEDDDFKETKGYKRIVQALLAHTWSDLTLKEPPTYKPTQKVLESLNEDRLTNVPAGVTADNPPKNSEEVQGQDEAAASQNEKKENLEKSKSEKIDSLLDEDRWLFDAVGKEDPGSESFESLFQRILNMKEKAESLQGEERKLYAEKVAVEFWRALGGDEDEIAGLESDES